MELKDTMLYWIVYKVGNEKKFVTTKEYAMEIIDESCVMLPAYTLQDVLDALPEKQHITFKSNNEDVTELCDLALSKNTVWYECDKNAVEKWCYLDDLIPNTER